MILGQLGFVVIVMNSDACPNSHANASESAASEEHHSLDPMKLTGSRMSIQSSSRSGLVSCS